MDSILYIGSDEEKLPKFLQKLGYTVVVPNGSNSLPEITGNQQLDLLLLDGRLNPDANEFFAFLKTQESTKTLPLVYLAGEESDEHAREQWQHYERLEIIRSPFSIGAIAGKIATQLRLRKFAGRDELKSNLAEVNATLRDYNQRFKKELEEARAIQQSLLPQKLPSDARMQLAVSYQPLEGVGGDWYFAQKIEGDLLTLQVADVTGHGLAAAFVGSMAKLAMAAVKRIQPDELLAEMNRLMAPQIPEGRFVTMGSYLYDPASGKIKCGRAGHPPALLHRAATNEVIQLMGEGFAIGFFEDSEYTSVEDQLAPGDSFLMFTDGISEAQNRSMATYGFDRLSGALQKAKGAASEMLNDILDDFDLFREERLLKDDVTVMLLKRVV